MSKYLVTGATGFLGSHLVERLLERIRTGSGLDSIRILSRGRNPWAGEAGIEFLQGDILDRPTVESAVDGVHGVYHLAGFVTRDERRSAELFDTHLRGTQILCEAALAAGSPRILVCSSSGTIAVSRKPRMHTEDSPYANAVVGNWPYYLSKIFQEKLALGYHERHSLPVVIVNPSLLLGPGDDRGSSTGDVRLFLNRQIPNIPSGGLNFVDVRDAAVCLARAMESGIPGRRYLVGGHNMTVKEFFLLLERVSGVRAPSFSLSETMSRRGARIPKALYSLLGKEFPLDDATIEMAYRFWYFDNSRARTELGLAPRDAETTALDTVRYIVTKGGGAAAAGGG